ncbi:hypothetical protein EDB85DRAFT_2145591 [Lactarius pseudohatsudake]|nr:hypothetical protein EDB85DRAFT_2145591 [Lactarius pseudohatsudake]
MGDGIVLQYNGGDSRGLRILPMFTRGTQTEDPIGADTRSANSPTTHTTFTRYTSGLLTTEDAGTSIVAAAVDVDLLLGSADESDAFLPSDGKVQFSSVQHPFG